MINRHPVMDMEQLTHRIRTKYRRLHVRQNFYELKISAEARDLLLKFALFMDIATYEVRLHELVAYIYNYNRPFQDLLHEILTIRGLCHQPGFMTVVFNEEVLVRLGVKVVDSNKLHQEASGQNLTPEQAKLYEQAIEVMKGYNAVRSRFYQRQDGFVPSPLKFTSVLRNASVRVAQFCAVHKIEDYELYLMTLCHDRKWEVLPYLNHCHQEWCYDIYHRHESEVRSLIVEEKRLQVQDKEESKARVAGTKKSIFRDLFASVERIKLNFHRTGEGELCMNYVDETLGFHPKSRICAVCILAENCKLQLISKISQMSGGLVDIIALRNGEQDLPILQKKLNNEGIDLDLFDGTASSAQSRIEERIHA